MASFLNLSLQKRIGLLVLTGLVIGLSLFSWLGLESVNESVDRVLEERLTIARVMASRLDENMTQALMHLENNADFSGVLPTRQQFETAADSLRHILAESGILA